MQKEINFYHHLPKPPKYQLPNKYIIYSFVMLSLFLLSISFFQTSYYSLEMHRLTKLYGREVTAENYLVAFNGDNSYGDDAKNTVRSLDVLSESIAKKQKLLSILEKLPKTTDITLTEQLKAVAHDMIKGAWLYHIAILNRGEQIELKGCALTTTYIFTFFKNVKNNKTFSQYDFKMIRMSENIEKDRCIEYEIMGHLIGSK